MTMRVKTPVTNTVTRGGDEEVEHIGHMLVEPLLQHAHDEDGDDHGDDVSLVSLQGDIVEAEELHLWDTAGSHDVAGRRMGGVHGGSGRRRKPLGSRLRADDLIGGGLTELPYSLGDVPCVYEVGVVHDHADDAAEKLVTSKDAGGREADQDLQEHEGCV